MQCKKTFSLCLFYIFTFPIASFHFFCEFIELGSKLGFQRAQLGEGGATKSSYFSATLNLGPKIKILYTNRWSL